LLNLYKRSEKKIKKAEYISAFLCLLFDGY